LTFILQKCGLWQEVRSYRLLYFSNLDAMDNPKLLICATTGFQMVGVMPIIEFNLYMGWI